MWHLLDLLFPPRPDERALREESLGDFLHRIMPRTVPETRPVTTILLPFHETVVRAAIHEAKYHGSERAFRYLGTVLLEYLRDTDELGRRAVIIPIPLGAARRKERGYNQVEEVAKISARELNIPLDTSLLTRAHETASQVSLPREKREKNMRGAFGATQPLDPSVTYILVDDVITTGATLQSAIDALIKAGAINILPVALAH